MKIIEDESKLFDDNIVVAKRRNVCENINMSKDQTKFLPDDYVFKQGRKVIKLTYYSTAELPLK